MTPFSVLNKGVSPLEKGFDGLSIEQIIKADEPPLQQNGEQSVIETSGVTDKDKTD